MTTHIEMHGQVALVTGASRGIGAAAARIFAAEGARVVVHYRSGRAEAEALAAELPDAVALGADVTREDEVDALFAAALERYGRIDSCVANAGVWIERPAPVAEMTLEQFRRTLDVDLIGVFLTCRAFLRVVGRQGSGSLVLVGSTAGLGYLTVVGQSQFDTNIVWAAIIVVMVLAVIIDNLRLKTR